MGENRIGMVQTILDPEALQRLREDARNEGLSVAAYLRHPVLSRHERTSLQKLEARVSELEKHRGK
jgi:hypothetical protein